MLEESNIKRPIIHEKMQIPVSIARPEDWPVVKNIMLEAMKEEPEAIGSPYEEWSKLPDTRWQKDLTNERKFFVIAKEEEKPIGIAAATQENRNDWNLYSVYMNDKFRGKGISTKILKEVLDEISKRHGETINLSVGVRQEEAVGLYKKFGFKIIDGNSTKKDYKYVMRLNLADLEDEE